MTSPDGTPDASHLRSDRFSLARPDLDLAPLLPPADVQLVARLRLDPLDVPPRPTTTSLGTALGRGTARVCFGAVDALRGRRDR